MIMKYFHMVFMGIILLPGRAVNERKQTKCCPRQVLLRAAGAAACWLHGQLGLQVLGREVG